MINKSSRVKKVCIICHSIFYVDKNVSDKGKGKLCSRKCQGVLFSEKYKNRDITWGKKISQSKMGHVVSLETRKKISETKKDNWKEEIKNFKFSDNVTYEAKHIRIYKKYGFPRKCEKCGMVSDNNRKIHWANISGKYLNIRSDWMRLCVSCHKKFDLNKIFNKKEL